MENETQLQTPGQPSPAPAAAGRGPLVLGSVVLLVTLLIWAGVHNARERRIEMQDSQTAHATLVPSGSEPAVGTDGPAPMLQGKPAPAFSLVSLDGKKVSLADYKGKPVLVNFWATWCGPCKLEMPWFEEFSKKYAADGLVILGVAADDAGKNVIAETAHKAGVTYPILLKSDKVTEDYGGVDFLPESFYVDRSGKIMLETAGLDDNGGKDRIEANIKKLIAQGR